MTKRVLKVGDHLKASINDFEKHRQVFAREVTGTLEDTDRKLSKSKPDLPRVAEDWEGKWKDIQGRYRKLEDDFSRVGKDSEAYFRELEKLASELQDQSLKESEKTKNSELKSRWEVTYKEASDNIGKVRQLLKDGNDFHRVLVMSSVREKIEQNITDLKSISERAKVLLKDLEKFTIEGKKLVAG